VIVPVLLSAIHVLTLAFGLAAVFLRGRAVTDPLDDAGWWHLVAADNAWRIAAGLWIASGLGRLFLGGNEPSFYWRVSLFWVKLALFGLVFALELAPMLTFIRVRRRPRPHDRSPRPRHHGAASDVRASALLHAGRLQPTAISPTAAISRMLRESSFVVISNTTRQ
jgi:uncharacterized membrane protein